MQITNRSGFNFKVTEKYQAGIVLNGAEVKSVQKGSVSLSDSFVRVKNNEAFLYQMYIAPYQKNSENYDPKRIRKLLLHRQEIENIRGKIEGLRLTAIPLRVYTVKNLVKIELALGRKMKKYEKREDLRRKAVEREVEQTLREEKLKQQKTVRQ